MSLYTFIIDPINKQKYNYNTVEFKEILKKYIKIYKSAGKSEKLDASEFLDTIKKQDKIRQSKALQKRINRIKLANQFKS